MVRESSVSLAVAIRQSPRFTKCIIICFLRLRICNLSEKTRTTYSYQSVNKMTTFQPVTKVKAKTNCNAKSFCLKSVSLTYQRLFAVTFSFDFLIVLYSITLYPGVLPLVEFEHVTR